MFFPARFRFLLPSASLFATLLLVINVPSILAVGKCSRQSGNKAESPDFLCDVDVTVIRAEACNMNITERYLFPHTTGRNAFRDIPKLDDSQSVENIRVFRDDKKLATTTEPGDENEIKVIIPTVKSDDPVLIVVSYTLVGGVMRFTDTCGQDGDPDPSKNIIRWRSGTWDKSFDKLRVTFTTDENDIVLQPLFGDRPASGSTEQQVIVEKKNVKDNVEVYVSEEGNETCRQIGCFPSGFSITPIGFGFLESLLRIIRS